MDDRLLVPASRALLDGWAGPVIYRDPAGWHSGVLIETVSEHAEVYALSGADKGGTVLVPISDMALDLSHAECRDRVARVLWSTATGWSPLACPRVVAEAAGRGVELLLLDGSDCPDQPRWLWPEGVTPSGPGCPRGGYRLVNALALAAVAREVLHG